MIGSILHHDSLRRNALRFNYSSVILFPNDNSKVFLLLYIYMVLSDLQIRQINWKCSRASYIWILKRSITKKSLISNTNEKFAFVQNTSYLISHNKNATYITIMVPTYLVPHIRTWCVRISYLSWPTLMQIVGSRFSSDDYRIYHDICQTIQHNNNWFSMHEGCWNVARGV